MIAITKWVTNDAKQKITFLQSIQAVLNEALAVDIAVSYAQLSGWELLEPMIQRIPTGGVRMLITGQLAITQPEALRRALAAGVRLRNYDGRIYHPKVYIIYGAAGQPSTAILGSANISESALTTSVEAGISTTDPRLLKQMRVWFDDLFDDAEHSSDVDDALLKKLDLLWKRAAARRVRAGGRQRTPPARPRRADEISPENNEVLEDLFATIRAPIGILSFDHAGNNVRNLDRARDVLIRYPNLSNKERSELHLLGFLKNGKLTALGRRARSRKTVDAFAKEWCGWVARQTDADLRILNVRLASFKKAATQFWNLRPEVSKFFLQNLRSSRQRVLLQTIELLCNGSSVARQLSLNQLKLLAPMIMSADGFSTFVAKRVHEYQDNKGSRSWSSEDRRTVLTAWRDVTRRGRARP